MNMLRAIARHTLPSAIPPSRLVALVLLVLAAACTAPVREGVSDTSSAYTTRSSPASNIASFQALDGNTAYALDTSGRLWRDTVSPAAHATKVRLVIAFGSNHSLPSAPRT